MDAAVKHIPRVLVAGFIAINPPIAPIAIVMATIAFKFSRVSLKAFVAFLIASILSYLLFDNSVRAKALVNFTFTLI